MSESITESNQEGAALSAVILESCNLAALLQQIADDETLSDAYRKDAARRIRQWQQAIKGYEKASQPVAPSLPTSIEWSSSETQLLSTRKFLPPIKIEQPAPAPKFIRKVG